MTHRVYKSIIERKSEDIRYFVSDIAKTKFSPDKVYGDAKCLICGNKIILDIHHLYKYDKRKLDKDQLSFFKIVKKKALINKYAVDPIKWTRVCPSEVDKLIFLCPNHHAVYHRLIEGRYSPYYTTPFEGIRPIKWLKKKFIKIEKDNPPCYREGKISHEPNLKTVNIHGKLLNRPIGKDGNALPYVYYKSKNKGMGGKFMELHELLSKDFVNKPPRCLICGYQVVLDLHHIHKEKKAIFLCPNHHYIIHRHLEDKDGTRLSLKEIKKGITKVEKENKDYYKEVSKKEYPAYIDYKRLKGKF